MVAAIVLGLVFVTGPGGAFASPAAKNPNAIRCPVAPAHWGEPAVTKIVTTPASVPNAVGAGLDGENQARGGDQVTVACTYYDTDAKQIVVTVTWALPTDANPESDFYYGCGSGGVSWSGANRVYRVASVSERAMAFFLDDSRFLAPPQVGAFESLTRSLLRNVRGYAHPCT